MPSEAEVPVPPVPSASEVSASEVSASEVSASRAQAPEVYSLSTSRGAEPGLSCNEKPCCEEFCDVAISIVYHVSIENETDQCSGDRMPAYLWGGVLIIRSLSIREG